LSRLLVAITAHGQGHAVLLAPVVAALARALPRLEVAVRSALPPAVLGPLFPGARLLAPREPSDFGMRMRADAPLEVDLPASRAAYARVLAEWDARLDTATAEIESLRPDLVLASAGFMPLAAAARAGVPAALLSPLNWAGILAGYGADGRLVERLTGAYATAREVLATTPGMAMSELPQARRIGLLGRPGTERRAALRARLGLPAEARLALLSLGGGATPPLPLERWPRLDGLTLLLAGPVPPDRADLRSLDGLGFDFPDLMASVDAFVGKPGYGAFGNAGVAGLPVLYQPRDDWPEAPALVAWLERRGAARAIAPEALAAGALAGPLRDLLDGPRPAPLPATGIADAMAVLEPYLA